MPEEIQQAAEAAPEVQPAPEAAPAEFSWPDDWAARLAGDDDKEHKHLIGKGWKDPSDVFRGYRELEKKLSSGDFVAKLPENPTDEQLSNWRAKQGIPNEPSEYMEMGEDVPEETKAMLGQFFDTMHGVNATPDVVKAAMEFVDNFGEGLKDQKIQAVAAAAEKAKYQLVEEFGADRFEPMKGAITKLVQEHAGPRVEGEMHPVLDLQLADGTVLGDSPEFFRMLAPLAQERYGDELHIASNPGVITSAKEEYDKLMSLQEKDPKKYTSEEVQKRIKEITPLAFKGAA